MTSSVTVWTSTATVHAQTLVAQIIRAARGSEMAYDSLPLAGRDVAEFRDCINDAFNRLVTMTSSDSSLHIVAVIPLFEKDSSTQIRTLYDACSPLTIKFLYTLLDLLRQSEKSLTQTPMPPPKRMILINQLNYSGLWLMKRSSVYHIP